MSKGGSDDKSVDSGDKSPNSKPNQKSPELASAFPSLSSSATIGFGTIDSSVIEDRMQSVVDGPCLSKWSNSPFKSNHNTISADAKKPDPNHPVHGTNLATKSSASATGQGSAAAVPGTVAKGVEPNQGAKVVRMDQEFPPVEASFPPLAATITADNGTNKVIDTGTSGSNNNNVTTPIKTSKSVVGTPASGSGKKKGKAAWKPLTVEFNTKPLSDRDIRGQSGRMGKPKRDFADHGPPGGHPGFRRNVPGGSVSSDGGGADDFRGRRRFTDGSASAPLSGPFKPGSRHPSGPRGPPFAGNGGSPRGAQVPSPLTVR